MTHHIKQIFERNSVVDIKIIISPLPHLNLLKCPERQNPKFAFLFFIIFIKIYLFHIAYFILKLWGTLYSISENSNPTLNCLCSLFSHPSPRLILLKISSCIVVKAKFRRENTQSWNLYIWGKAVCYQLLLLSIYNTVKNGAIMNSKFSFQS